MTGAASIFRYNENVSPVQLGNENGTLLFDITEYNRDGLGNSKALHSSLDVFKLRCIRLRLGSSCRMRTSADCVSDIGVAFSRIFRN